MSISINVFPSNCLIIFLMFLLVSKMIKMIICNGMTRSKLIYVRFSSKRCIETELLQLVYI